MAPLKNFWIVIHNFAFCEFFTFVDIWKTMDSFCEQGLVYCNFSLEGVHFPGPVLVHVIVQCLLVSGSFEVVNVQFLAVVHSVLHVLY
jgi:hypothetical protein